MKYSESNGRNFNKVSIRRRILNSCEHLLSRPLHTITLPNRYFDEFEKILLDKFYINRMSCFEMNNKLFEELCNYWRENGALCLNGNVLQACNYTLDICWLDLMCSLTSEREKQIINFIKNNHFTEDSILSITLCNFFRSRHKAFPIDYMEKGFVPTVLQNLPKNSQIIDYQSYYNNKSWMYNYIFKINH